MLFFQVTLKLNFVNSWDNHAERDGERLQQDLDIVKSYNLYHLLLYYEIIFSVQPYNMAYIIDYIGYIIKGKNIT